MGDIVSIIGGEKRELRYLRRTKFPDMMNLNGYADRWLEYLKVNRNKSYNTVKAYGNDINQFIGFLENCQILTYKVDPEIVEDWIAWLSKARDNSPRTIARKVESLRGFYKYLRKIRIITQSENPMNEVDTPVFDTNIPDNLSLSELNKLLNIIDTTTPKGFRNYLMILIYIFGGARKSELINADLQDLNLETMSLKVLGKGNKERIIMLPHEVMLSNNRKAELKVLCHEYITIYRLSLCKRCVKTTALFINPSGKRLGRQSVYNIFVKTAEKAGIKRRITPHMARHTCGMLLTELGVDSRIIRKHLGHSSAQMTDLYSKVRDIKYRQSINAFRNLAADLSTTMGVPAEEL